jgi:hypothetical protein
VPTIKTKTFLAQYNSIDIEGKGFIMKKLWKSAGIMALMIVLAAACALMLQGKPAYAKVKLNKKTVYLAPGDTLQLKVKGTKKKVKWVSSKKKVATVTKKGKIKAKKIGTAKIYAKVGKKKYKCKVIVEQKNINRAKKLRNYVLKKGKYNSSNKAYELAWYYMDGSNNSTDAVISAYKGKYDLLFTFYEDEESSYRSKFTMKINLISGKASVKTGDIEKYYDGDVDDTCDEITIYGKITTAYDGKGNGLTLAKTIWTEEDKDSNEVSKESSDESDLALLNEGVINRINAAFKYWNKMFSKKYPALKKAGISMKTIGFSKWK